MSTALIHSMYIIIAVYYSGVFYAELDAVALTNQRNVDDIYFPDLEEDLEREFGNAPAQARLPRDFLIARGANGNHIT